MTHTVATLSLPPALYWLIRDQLVLAGYTHAIDGDLVDMTGIGLLPEPSSPHVHQVPDDISHVRQRAHGVLPADCLRRLDAVLVAYDELRADWERLDALINNPQTADFLEAVRSEVAHQVQRWGTVGDRAKEPSDWFWLLGYLGGKALAASLAGDKEKARHHTISTAAVLANWWAHITLGKGEFMPGASDLQKFLEATFGKDVVAGASQ